jgi:hypothetical protein
MADTCSETWLTHFEMFVGSALTAWTMVFERDEGVKGW